MWSCLADFELSSGVMVSRFSLRKKPISFYQLHKGLPCPFLLGAGDGSTLPKMAENDCSFNLLSDI